MCILSPRRLKNTIQHMETKPQEPDLNRISQMKTCNIRATIPVQIYSLYLYASLLDLLTPLNSL